MYYEQELCLSHIPISNENGDTIISKSDSDDSIYTYELPIIDNYSTAFQDYNGCQILTESDILKFNYTKNNGKDRNELFKCNVKTCNFVCILNSKKMLKHQDRHNKECNYTEDLTYQCDEEGCDWAFKTFFKLKRHHISHTRIKDYMCDICQRTFTTVYNMKSHLKIHERPLSFVCSIMFCEQAFGTQKALDFHNRTLHGDSQKNFNCPIPGCDRTFFSAVTMGSHKRSHLHDGFKCDYKDCGKEFRSKCRLTSHTLLHTGEKPYPCTIGNCEWRFVSASKLKRHILRHTGVRSYPCTFSDCNKAFSRKEHLTVHLNSHTGVKPFGCTFPGCKIFFSSKSSLLLHMKRHENNRILPSKLKKKLKNNHIESIESTCKTEQDDSKIIFTNNTNADKVIISKEPHEKILQETENQVLESSIAVASIASTSDCIHACALPITQEETIDEYSCARTRMNSSELALFAYKKDKQNRSHGNSSNSEYHGNSKVSDYFEDYCGDMISDKYKQSYDYLNESSYNDEEAVMKQISTEEEEEEDDDGDESTESSDIQNLSYLLPPSFLNANSDLVDLISSTINLHDLQ